MKSNSLLRAFLAVFASTLMLAGYAIPVSSQEQPETTAAETTAAAVETATETVTTKQAEAVSESASVPAPATTPGACVSDGKIHPSEVSTPNITSLASNGELRAWTRARLQVDLVLTKEHCAGDSISIKAENATGIFSPVGADVEMRTANGDVVGYATYRGHEITITLSDVVENEDNFNFQGNAWWEVSMQKDFEPGPLTVRWVVDGVTRTQELTISPCPNCAGVPDFPAKWGNVNGGEITITLAMPRAEQDGQKIEFRDELLSSNQKIRCDKPAKGMAYSETDYWGNASNGKTIYPVITDCSSTEISGYVIVDAGYKANIYVYAEVDPKDPGPFPDRLIIVAPHWWGKEPYEREIRRYDAGASGSYDSRTSILPPAPVLKGDATCLTCGDDRKQAKVVIPEGENLRYYLNDKLVSAGEYPLEAGSATVKVEAVDPSLYVLEGQTVWRFSVAGCSCTTTTPPPPPSTTTPPPPTTEVPPSTATTTPPPPVTVTTTTPPPTTPAPPVPPGSGSSGGGLLLAGLVGAALLAGGSSSGSSSTHTAPVPPATPVPAKPSVAAKPAPVVNQPAKGVQPAKAAPVAAPQKTLAQTGANTTWLAIIAVAIVVAGILLTVRGIRRNN